MRSFVVETFEPQAAAAIRSEVPMAELREVFDRGFPAVMEAVGRQGAAVVGPPFGLYPRSPGATVAVAVGFPVAGPITPDGEVEPLELPGGPAVTGTHVGPYEALEQTYEALLAWAKAEGHVLGAVMWESYLSDPSAEPDPAAWRTLIVWPLA